MNKLFITVTDDIKAALTVIDSGGRRIALVVDDAGRLLGTLADGDARRHLLNGGSLDDPIEAAYHRNPLTTESATLTAELRREMERRGVTCVPVLKDGKPVSLLSLSDAADSDLPAILGGKPLFVEPLPVARPTLPPFAELEDDLRQAIESGMITNGPQVTAFEEAAATYIGVSPEQVIALSSCTIGLTL
ncbi:CBS domain-containing protein, partial [bacterium]|nr:CBS domain-containing protein [bacterium]